MRKYKGFSLIELLIVVAIILVIAAIAIPNLLRSRMAANEASAVSSLRTINAAEITYASTYPDQGVAIALGTLGPGASGNTTASATYAGLLDDVLGCNTAMGSGNTCVKDGYIFDVSVPNATHPVVVYNVNANPVTANQTGIRYFYTDQTGVIRYNMTANAGSGDTVLQ